MNYKSKSIYNKSTFCNVLCIVVLNLYVGCSKQIISKKFEIENKLTCDIQADQAMMRQDYKSGNKCISVF
jgi:hypothetical protein